MRAKRAREEWDQAHIYIWTGKEVTDDPDRRMRRRATDPATVVAYRTIDVKIIAQPGYPEAKEIAVTVPRTETATNTAEVPAGPLTKYWGERPKGFRAFGRDWMS